MIMGGLVMSGPVNLNWHSCQAKFFSFKAKPTLSLVAYFEHSTVDVDDMALAWAWPGSLQGHAWPWLAWWSSADMPSRQLQCITCNAVTLDGWMDRVENACSASAREWWYCQYWSVKTVSDLLALTKAEPFANKWNFRNFWNLGYKQSLAIGVHVYCP